MWPFNKAKKQKTVVRKYAAAQQSRLFADWSSGQQSTDQEIRAALSALRNRSRQLGRDNDYVRAVFRTIEQNVVGEGIPFQSQIKMVRGDKLNKELNDKVENLWSDWTCKEYCHSAGKLHFEDIERLIMRNVAESGEAFIRIIRQGFDNSKVPMALEVIEGDMLDESFNMKAKNGANEIRMGVELNQWGRPVAYHFFEKNPSNFEFDSSTSQKRVRVDAKDVIHLFISERPSQTRGVPWLASAMGRLHQVYGFEEASVVQQRAAASLMGFIETPEGELTGDDVEGEQRVTDFEAGVFKQLKAGEKIVVPTLPNTIGNFDPFMRSMLRAVSAGCGLSYESVSKDYSQSNYSSTRQSLLDERQHYKVLQKWMIRNFHQEIFEDWLETAYLFGAIDLPNFMQQKENYAKVKWMPRGWSWIDPLKEVEAYKAAVKAGFMTQSEVITLSGGDIEELMDQRKREVDLAEANDLYFDSNPESEMSGNEAKVFNNNSEQTMSGDANSSDKSATPRAKNKK